MTTYSEAENYMKQALELAAAGMGHVDPNPMVGALIVKDGKVISKGFHSNYGGLHAERDAIEKCPVSAAGSDMYVTLEPCCHYGKQPPCTDAIIKAGIRRVYIGSSDPNPLVAGKGVNILKSHGIEVVENVLKDECDRFNYVFFHHIKTERPYVVMKYAMTMDGKIASVSGKSKWITGEQARKKVHKDRNRYMGIMVGIGTVLADDPLLNCRMDGGKNPVRIICDSSLKIPLHSQIVKTSGTFKTVIAASDETCRAAEEKVNALEAAGCTILPVPMENGHINLNILMEQLGKNGINSILLEGGGTLNWSALQSGIVNRIQAYIAPKLLGGKTALSPIGGTGADSPAEGITLAAPEITVIGEDILLESEVIGCSQG